MDVHAKAGHCVLDCRSWNPAALVRPSVCALEVYAQGVSHFVHASRYARALEDFEKYVHALTCVCTLEACAQAERSAENVHVLVCARASEMGVEELCG